MTDSNTPHEGSSKADSRLDSIKLDPDFKFEIAREPGGENILYCFQCGTCVSVCPVSAKNPKYDPRKIIWMTLLGMRDEVLSSEAIWLCSTCYSCYVRCPQNVKITSVISAIQNIASREGHLHSSYQAGLDMVEKTGRTVELSEFENQKREKLNCPPIVENPEKVKKILAETGIQKNKEKKVGGEE
ncbi:MAG: 4Fe-4S dicluster domain-containing protein [Thermoplasmata archaeon]|nr:MAG: 4Fe-4S dicluster domain-containing protein [Thermoplasmata archaeon]